MLLSSLVSDDLKTRSSKTLAKNSCQCFPALTLSATEKELDLSQIGEMLSLSENGLQSVQH